MSQKLVVAFRPLRSCMVSLPARWASALFEQNKGCMVFKITWNEGSRSAFVAWSGNVSQTNEQRDRLGELCKDVLEIDGSFGSKLGLTEGTKVSLEYQSNVVTCTMAEMVPEHFDDWEILELNAGAVETRLLRQARVVAVDQPIVFWLNSSTSVTLHATNVKPATSVCLLDNDTEVVVAPKVRNAANLTDSSQDQLASGGSKQKQKISCLRVAAVEDIPYGVVYVNDQATIAKQASGQQLPIARIGHISAASAAVKSSEDPAETDKALQPWLVFLETSKTVQPGVLLASTKTLTCAAFSIGELVRAELVPTTVPPKQPAKLSFVSETPNVDENNIRDLLQSLLKDTRKLQLVLYVGAVISSIGDSQAQACLASFTLPESEEAVDSPHVPLLLTAQTMGALEIVCDTKPLSLGKDNDTRDKQPGTVLAGIDGFLSQAWQAVESAVMSHSADGSSGVLLCGRRGSGKSSIARHLKRQVEMQQQNRLVYCRHVDCARLSMEPRAQAAKEALQAIIDDVVINQPALLILDDLDGLLPAETENADSRRVRQLADALVGMLDLRDGRQVAVVATAAGRLQLHAKLFASGLFQSVLEIPAPGKAERELILAEIARSNATAADTADINFSVLSYLTEGYMPADLYELYERAVHEATIRVMEQIGCTDVLVKHVDLVRAHAGFKPMSLRGVQLQTSQTRWSDIGGLEDTRRQLRETLELPTKYAAIFATSPLRLRSGVLLFGYPGCGKTLLASAIARECGLNFIATKGPELLSKYIGSSEQSVRDLFKRAVAASPCVLFFDEFESIAPRRGHDNTGVTDRVVNQFLTEMDGAEGLKGVYVLAATSRPDLIDPALLRPGRLDKAFLCDMPDQHDRKDILLKQASKVKCQDINWDAVSQRTQGFTGADLQALVYNAFLEAVHENMASADIEHKSTSNEDTKQAEFTLLSQTSPVLSKVERTQLAERLFNLVNDSQSTSSAQDIQAATPLVTMAHFESALAMTQSSLGEQDRIKFEAIYRDFVDGKKGKPRKPVEQRATLA
ncbi:Peroxisome biosynthesis protein pex1 [Coemansia brasiliensis]|uniref:Peroxisomal ATPase PEX1 n=1 Tax=Coemansia brasiliensis TaxID=2650707 RepID=A0A9W8M043_9FUNG|nr:Peroxisome biosynthesis protein pex1 [Coemansia brasiliensis]